MHKKKTYHDEEKYTTIVRVMLLCGVSNSQLKHNDTPSCLTKSLYGLAFQLQ